MRVLVWPAGGENDGSANYRLRFPAEALARQGCDVEITESGPAVLWDREWSGDTAPLDAKVLGLAEKPDADVVVIQRPGRAHWAELIPHLQAAGVRVVVDLDDDFESIPAANVAASTYDPKLNPRHSRDWIRKACDLADLVTVSTGPLGGRYGRRGRVRVLPNLVPERYLSIEPERKLTNALGWSGSVDTHPGDLETVGNAVAWLLWDNPAWSVHVIGTGKGVAKRLRLSDAAVSSTAKWLPFVDYPTALAALTVGMVPLQRSRFNAAKSALKLMEMTAVGVPVVAAKTPDNERMHAHGIGLLASSPSDWRKHLGLLMTDEDARVELAAKGRAVMAAFTYEQWADLWADAWESTLQRTAAA